MTEQPGTEQQQTAPDAAPLLTLAAAQAAAMLALEKQAAHIASWRLRVAVQAIVDGARARFLLAQNSPDPVALERARTWACGQLRTAAALYLRPGDVRGPLADAVAQAKRLGRVHAEQQVAVQRPESGAQAFTRPAAAAFSPLQAALGPLAAVPPPPAGPTVPATVVPKPLKLLGPVADGARDTARARIADTIRALAPAQTPRDLDNALTIALRAPDDLALAAAWIVNHTANAVARDEAIRLGALLMWIAERDACVVCTALSGHTANVMLGEGFDEFATFGPHRPPEPWPPGHPLTGPPRHPRCRCQTVVYFGVQAGQPDLAESLRREALRSILRGFSRPSESHRTRLVAAERALRSGQAARMPKSVRAYAASAVLAGRFPTRAVPTGPARQPRRAA